VKLAIFGVKSFVAHHSFGPTCDICPRLLYSGQQYNLPAEGRADGIFPYYTMLYLAPYRCHESAEL